jgi:hypothetical protein
LWSASELCLEGMINPATTKCYKCT